MTDCHNYQALYAEAKGVKERLAQEVSCETSIQEACAKRDIEMLKVSHSRGRSYYVFTLFSLVF